MNFSLNLLGSEVWGEIVSSLANLWERTGLYELVDKFTAGGWQSLVMIAIACLLVYLAVVKKFEPLLLLPIAFGMFIVNIPGAYRILFGTKGYILSDSFKNVEYARGTFEEIYAVLKVDGFALTIEQFKNVLENSKEIISIFTNAQVVDFAGIETAFNAGQLDLSKYGLTTLADIQVAYNLVNKSTITLGTTVLEISSETVVFPNFIGITAFGCKIEIISLHKYLKTIITLTTFIPPPAEPALPPINIKANNNTFAAIGH